MNLKLIKTVIALVFIGGLSTSAAATEEVQQEHSMIDRFIQLAVGGTKQPPP